MSGKPATRKSRSHMLRPALTTALFLGGIALSSPLLFAYKDAFGIGRGQNPALYFAVCFIWLGASHSLSAVAVRLIDRKLLTGRS